MGAAGIFLVVLTMPHFIIEHADALPDEDTIKDAMNIMLDCGANCGFIQRADSKVRVVPYTHVLFGDGRSRFIHVTVKLLAGRTDDQKESLSVALRDALDTRFPAIDSISIDIRDMNPACYKKRLV